MALADLPLLDLVPALSPAYAAPAHLAEWCALLESALSTPVRGLCSVPIRHFKTQTTLHAIVWLMLRDPTLRFILMTFDHERAEWLGNEARTLCERADSMSGSSIGPERGQNKKIQWTNAHGGGVAAMSSDQSREGTDVDILIVDDPMTELEAGDPSVSDKIDRAIAHYTARVGRPGRAGSVFLVMSRLALDDPMGRRLERKGVVDWRSLEFPAILDIGTPQERAFAPDVMTLARLKSIRAEWAQQDPSERGFFARYMNNPLAFADGFFEGQTPWLGDIPSGAPIIIGVDCAFTQGKKSDYFAAVLMAVVDRRCVIFNVIRHRRGLSQAIETLEVVHAQYPEARFISYTSGQEIGVYHNIFELTGGRVMVECMAARWNKATRASKAAQAWRAGQILVRLGQPFTGVYLGEMHAFNGSETGVDDQVDATVAGYDGAMLGRPAEGFGAQFTFGHPVL
jgi:phage terminase large subunit-like protein